MAGVTFKAGIGICASDGTPYAAGATITGQVVYANIYRNTRTGVIGHWGIEFDGAGSETGFKAYPSSKPIGTAKKFNPLRYDAGADSHKDNVINLPVTASTANTVDSVAAYDGWEFPVYIGDGCERVALALDMTGTAWGSSTSAVTVHFWQDNQAER
jgi:hypothetical protein